MALDVGCHPHAPPSRQSDGPQVELSELRHPAREMMIRSRRQDRAVNRGRAGGSNMTTYNVGYLVGSLAKASINRKLSRALYDLPHKSCI